MKKIRIYDKGADISSREGLYNLLVKYRSGDMWAPQVEQVEALHQELTYFVDCISRDITPFNDGTGRPPGRQDVGSCQRISPQEGNPGLLMNPYLSIGSDVKLGKDVELSRFINLYGCEIGDQSKIGAFVEIQKNVKVGKRCKISSHTFICEGRHH